VTRPDRDLFRKRSDTISLAVVAGHVGLVLAPVYLAALTGPGLHLVLCWLWTGLSMQGLLNLLHECAHGHVFRDARWSETLAHWLLAPLMGASFEGYRSLHWKHHRNLGTDDDPKYSYHEDIRGWKLASLVLRCLTLVEAVRKFQYQAGSARDVSPSFAWLLRAVLVHAVFVGSLVLVASTNAPDLDTSFLRGAIAYLAVYGYGVVSLSVFAATLRAIAEHQGNGTEGMADGRAALRNLRSNPFTDLVFACHGFGDHATHHVEPGIPAYNLARATGELAANEPHLVAQQGYVGVLRRCFSPG